MSRNIAVLIAFSLLFAFPVALADEGDGQEGPAEESTWGVCVADDASEQGDEDSNGTVSSTPPFASTSEEDCDEASAPWNGTAGDDHVPADPPHDGDDNPGDEGQGQDDASEEGSENGDEAQDRREDSEEDDAGNDREDGSGENGSSNRP